jgi:hypothetical protein
MVRLDFVIDTFMIRDLSLETIALPSFEIYKLWSTFRDGF